MIGNRKGMDTAFLERASLWANVGVLALSVMAALVGACALYFSARLGALKDADLAKFQATATAQIAANNAEAEALKLQVATQQQRAAEAERALADLRSEVADRRLSDVQREQISSRLAGTQSVAIVVSPMTNPEAAAFADEIDALLRKLGWDVGRVRNRISTDNGLVVGAVSGVRFSKEADLLVQALRDAGLNPRIAEFRDGDASTSPPFQRGYLYVVVEHKSRPAIR